MLSSYAALSSLSAVLDFPILCEWNYTTYDALTIQLETMVSRFMYAVV